MIPETERLVDFLQRELEEAQLHEVEQEIDVRILSSELLNQILEHLVAECEVQFRVARLMPIV